MLPIGLKLEMACGYYIYTQRNRKIRVSETYASLVSVNDGDMIYLPLRSYDPTPASVVQFFIPSTIAISLHPIISAHSPLADYFHP